MSAKKNRIIAKVAAVGITLVSIAGVSTVTATSANASGFHTAACWSCKI